MSILKRIWESIRPKTIEESNMEYLSEATDLCDLERRMRRLQQGVSSWDNYGYFYKRR